MSVAVANIVECRVSSCRATAYSAIRQGVLEHAFVPTRRPRLRLRRAELAIEVISYQPPGGLPCTHDGPGDGTIGKRT